MKQDSLSKKAYTEIRRQILSNQLQAKSRIKEDTWATKLGVSRMAVREALNRLLGERLVSFGEKGGYFVTTLSAEDIHTIRELREILEVGAIRLAVKKMTKPQVEKLEKICNDFTAMAKEGYFSGACEADIKFHESIVEFACNDKLMQLYQSSHIPLFHQQLGKTQTLMSDYEQTDVEHRQIVKALKAKKSALAEEWLIKHFARGETAMLDME